jgi:cytochrome c553
MNKMLSSIATALVACVTLVSAHAQEVQGDAKAGATKNTLCIGCHGIIGYQASFPEVHKVPKISGQGAKYIISALNAYKKGDRKHPTMRGIASTLSEQDMADLGAFYAANGAVEGATALTAAPAATGDAAALMAKGNCVSCHGASFSAPIDPSYPRIAGQHGDYLFVALKSYKTDAANAQVGRNNAIMGGIAKQFSNAELKQIAAYVSGLPSDLKTVPENRFR